MVHVNAVTVMLLCTYMYRWVQDKLVGRVHTTISKDTDVVFE